VYSAVEASDLPARHAVVRGLRNILIVVEHGRRHMHLAGITAPPTGVWVIQQAATC
jgi:hypothetical protein